MMQPVSYVGQCFLINYIPFAQARNAKFTRLADPFIFLKRVGYARLPLTEVKNQVTSKSGSLLKGQGIRAMLTSDCSRSRYKYTVYECLILKLLARSCTHNELEDIQAHSLGTRPMYIIKLDSPQHFRSVNNHPACNCPLADLQYA